MNFEEFAKHFYVNPSEDPQEKAKQYLEDHQIFLLFQHLMAKIVHEKPEDPLAYIQEELRKLRENDPNIQKYRSELEEAPKH